MWPRNMHIICVDFEKMLYLRGQSFLHEFHIFRRARATFNDCMEFDLLLEKPSRQEILFMENIVCSIYLARCGIEDTEGDFVSYMMSNY